MVARQTHSWSAVLGALRFLIPAVALLLHTLGPLVARAQEAGELVLVRDHQPMCTIVMSPSAPAAAVTAGGELRYYLQQISGARIPLTTEDSLTADQRQGTLILVGESQLVRAAGADVGKLLPEGFVIKTTANRLILAGRDHSIDKRQSEMGTAFAVSAFLEDELGVRWLWPGPLGEVVPKQATIAIEPIDRTDTPALQLRKLRDALTNKSPTKYGRGRRLTNMDEEHRAQMSVASEDWLRRQRTGGSVNLNYHHAFGDWWDKYHTDHPAYFAQQLNGDRAWPLELGAYSRAKLCVSNPAVLEQYLQHAISFLNHHPNHLSISASPNDNAYGGHCMCAACKSWDAANAPQVELASVDSKGRRQTFSYPALSDRYVHFYNLAADRLQQQAPGRFIGGYAYGAWRTPPVKEKVRDNVIIGYVGFNLLSDQAWEEDRDNWDGWAKASRHLLLRPNLLHDGHGFPLVYVHRLGETFSHCAKSGLMGADFDSLVHHWAGQGLNYYVLAKLLWNPQADVDAIIDDYCRAGFGSAAPAVRDYFQALEEHTRQITAHISGKKKREFAVESLPWQTPAAFAALEKHLDRADLMAGDDATVRERIVFLRSALEYARLQSEAVRQVQSAKTAAERTKAQAAAEARQEFYRAHVNSFVIGAPELAYREAAKPQIFGRVYGKRDKSEPRED